MKLSVSNIAWSDPFDSAILDILRASNVQGIEIAPTKIWPEWEGMNESSASEVHDMARSLGFLVPALQAVLFGKPELMIFESENSREQTYVHLCQVADVASVLGAKCVVFGSPKNRDPLDLSADEAFNRGVEFFRRAGDYYAGRGISLCIEANPPQYACRFITDSHQAAELVMAVDSPGVGLHLDTACMMLAGEDPVQSVTRHFPLIRHFHVSEPDLGGFADPAVNHREIAGVLRNNNYDNWISIEMRPQENEAAGLEQALDFVSATYIS